MSTASSPASGDALAVDASLHLLATELADQLHTGDLEPSLLHVVPRDAGLDLGLRPLDGLRPDHFLRGFVAPDEWHALGVACTGKAFHTARRGTDEEPIALVCIVAIVSRSGEVATATRSSEPVLSDDPGPGDGPQVDLLKRALQLPTDPPPSDTAAYWAVEWLASLCSEDGVDWDRAVELHPAARLLGADRAEIGDEFAEMMSAFAHVFDWSRLRSLAAEDRFDCPDVDPVEAAWHDVGSFARHLLSRCPPLSVLRAHARDHLDPDVFLLVDAALDAAEVPWSTWPEEHAA